MAPIDSYESGAENWTLVASIVATRKLNDVNPAAYIAETLEAVIAGHPQSKVDNLMPWRFRKTSSHHQWERLLSFCNEYHSNYLSMLK